MANAKVEALMREQALLLRRAERRIAELERQIAAAPPRWVTGKTGLVVPAAADMDGRDFRLHFDLRHGGNRENYERLHDLDHEHGEFAHAHIKGLDTSCDGTITQSIAPGEPQTYGGYGGRP